MDGIFFTFFLFQLTTNDDGLTIWIYDDVDEVPRISFDGDQSPDEMPLSPKVLDPTMIAATTAE